MAASVLRLTRVSKSFGATRALTEVSLSVAAGEVRALIGENGAGKSTLLSLLGGVHAPDSGAMELDGRPYAPRDPRAARAAGVAMIHQELAIAPDLSLAENVALGGEPSRGGFIDRAAERERARAALARLTPESLDLDRPAREFPISVRQLVEIARAIAPRGRATSRSTGGAMPGDARVIVFDEPTSSLGPEDAARLFRAMRELASRGHALIVVTHFLEEVARFADSFTVLRDGAVVAEGPVAEATPERLVRAMSGRALDQLFPRVEHAAGDELLAVEALSGERLPRGVTLSVRRGEILGLAGLIGAGRSEFLRALFGTEPRTHGRVTLAGRELPARAPREAIRRGVGLLSEDRKGEGLALGLSLEENLTLSSLGPYSRGGWLELGRRREAAREWLRRVRCKPEEPAAPARELSGGNQQKVAFARLLHQGAELLLLDEPTRGVDVQTKAELYRAIGEEAARGRAVVLASSHFPELLHVCDRIAVFHRGRLADVRPASDWTESSLLASASGVAP